MVETETLIARARTDMVPLPIVVNTDVLHRNIDTAPVSMKSPPCTVPTARLLRLR